MNRVLAIFGVATIALQPIAVMAQDAPPPKAFLTDAIRGDNSEIMLGQMAERQGASQGTKDFGKTLVADHTQARQQVSFVAQSLDLTPTDQPTRAAQRERRKLSKLSGRAFDREFALYMIRDHKAGVDTFQAEARAANGPANQLASQQLPVLQRHLQMAESLERAGNMAER